MNPIELAKEIKERYRRYLQTTFYFRDPVLRASFEEALPKNLSKGPYLEATPIFKQGMTTRALFPELLGREPEQGFLNAVKAKRPLYRHQEQSIRHVFNGHNVVVATGTGSGKTESFLYPILLHLYQEFQAGSLCPGVRALVLYPMNALANDQRKRLGEICQRLADDNSPFQVTFGQYIGETPENENDSWRHARDHMANRLPGELVLRSEMRATPPHILLTNYSMLEYLLLRPDDSPLFDDGRARCWAFLVLDEAHQYRGAKGIEMGMLLRRLKQRLREGGRGGPFRCIATSATLVGGDGDKSPVAKFAADLFGETFNEQDVILGEVETILESGEASLGQEDYQSLSLSLALEHGTEAAERIAVVANKLRVSALETGSRAKDVGDLLKHDSRATELRLLVTDNPGEVSAIADRTFHDLPQPERVGALSELVALLLRAEDPATGARLISARYHLFLRSLEGAFLSFAPDKKILLDRRGAGDTALFEVGLCRECGQHYLVGKEDNHRLVEAVRDPGLADFGATFFLPVENEPVEDEDADDHETQTYKLCVRCAEIRRSSDRLRCGHNADILLQKQSVAKEREDQVPGCAVCGYQAPDPVREVVHGTDGPHAVIATTLYQELPENRKKVLAFADGRQEAAFFAWYLEDSYKKILGRNMLLKVAQKQAAHLSEGSSLQDMATGLRDVFRQKNLFPPATSDLQLRREAWLAIYREFLTDEPRISVEGVGLLRWEVRWPDWFQTPNALRTAPWSLSEREAREVIFFLFDSMRADGAVELHTENNISLNWTDLLLQAPQMRVSPVEKGKLRYAEKKWAGPTGKRVRFLEKLYTRISPGAAEKEAIDASVLVLRDVWDTLRRCDEHAPTANDRLLIPVEDARRLNPDWWRLRFVGEDDEVYRCETCGRIQTVCVRDLCPRHRCPGSLIAIPQRALEPNHYRLLYQAELPGSLRVEEHTAQLDNEKAREFQREFCAGKIHFLSCSTTFELGVDLGDLDTIFLRNVPPEAFNYAQRVGRSGRRSGRPGFAITYCKRGPHDLYHFAEPYRMLTGKIQPPVLALRNEKIIIRHIMAVALSFFFRAFKERFSKVDGLFGNLTSPCGVSDFATFLSSKRSEIEEAIRHILPEGMATQLGLCDGTWINKITGKESRFALAEAEVSSDFKAVIDLKEKAKNEDDFDTAKWAQRRAETIAKDEVLSFLSRKAVIPKYGFPVDVVELDTQRTQQNQEAFEVSLQRDLSIAISEFAPTSKLVANKKEWTSYGLKKVAEREWPQKLYARCAKHNVFRQWKEGELEPTMPCACRLRPYKYVIPQFGFVTNRDEPNEPKVRPPKVFSTRPYFAGRPLASEPGRFPMPAASPLVTVEKASPGLMVALCEGRRGEGFYVCGGCGAGFRSRQKIHSTPQGKKCSGTLEQVSLGHEFVTDVLQLQFHRAPPNGDIVHFAFSLAYAIVEGAAAVLDVPSVDLSTTVTHSDQHGVPPIILYDNVPGGAGLVARLEGEKVLKDCLQAASKRVAGACGCAPKTSCYGCLRHYRNQFAHPYMERGPVHDYLESILREWRDGALA
jgi:ATP-dependent helicase YprA (DUF1998 family)